MGSVQDWPQNRALIERFCARDVRVDIIVERFSALTGMTQADVEEMRAWVRQGLVTDIDSAVASPLNSQSELSELLANAGVLPIFGFPTKVRQLYFNPGADERHREDPISDRSLDLAVSLFSPGSQVVKDGWTYTANGFAAYSQGRGRKLVDPLGDPLAILRCPECGTAESATDGAADTTCPICHHYRSTTRMFMPRGFMTGADRDDRPMDEDDSSRAGRPVLGWTSLTEEPTTRLSGMEIWQLDQAQLLTINDNHGSLFDMHRRPNRTVVVGLTQNFSAPNTAGIGAAAIGDIRSHRCDFGPPAPR